MKDTWLTLLPVDHGAPLAEYQHLLKKVEADICQAPPENEHALYNAWSDFLTFECNPQVQQKINLLMQHQLRLEPEVITEGPKVLVQEVAELRARWQAQQQASPQNTEFKALQELEQKLAVQQSALRQLEQEYEWLYSQLNQIQPAPEAVPLTAHHSLESKQKSSPETRAALEAQYRQLLQHPEQSHLKDWQTLSQGLSAILDSAPAAYPAHAALAGRLLALELDDLLALNSDAELNILPELRTKLSSWWAQQKTTAWLPDTLEALRLQCQDFLKQQSQAQQALTQTQQAQQLAQDQCQRLESYLELVKILFELEQRK